MIQGCSSRHVFVNDTIKLHEEVSLPQASMVIYDVIRIIDGVPLFFEAHSSRFFNSFRLSGFEAPFSQYYFLKSIDTFVKAEGFEIGNIRCVYCVTEHPVFCIYKLPYDYPTDEMYRYGVKTDVMHAERSNPNIKQELAVRTVADRTIAETGLYEVLYVDNSGNVTEGSRTNVFFISDGEIFTALAADVLCGITRKHIFEVAESIGIHIKEQKIPVATIASYEAVFLSGTSPKILPIATIGNISYNTSNVLMQKMMHTFDGKIETDIQQFKTNKSK